MLEYEKRRRESEGEAGTAGAKIAGNYVSLSRLIRLIGSSGSCGDKRSWKGGVVTVVWLPSR
jgi:hypothetical protein